MPLNVPVLCGPETLPWLPLEFIKASLIQSKYYSHVYHLGELSCNKDIKVYLYIAI